MQRSGQEERRRQRKRRATLKKRKKLTKRPLRIAAVSGGPDSVYLLTCSLKGSSRLLLAHYNHGARGKESVKDQKFVEEVSGALGIPMEVGKKRSHAGNARVPGGSVGVDRAGFEGKARQERHAFLQDLKKEYGAETILMGHTADDQVETVLMRILEGSGIAGMKGIPRSTKNGIERPLLDTWREDILSYLRKHKIPFRVDRSNLDTRFERNWIRHVLLPLLETRYGKSVKRRIFTLGERFRELDVYIENTAYNWLENNSIMHEKRSKSKPPRTGGQEKKAIRIPRKDYADLPSLLRIRILQILCFEHLGTAPNERLLTSMDRLIVSGRSSALLSVGRGGTLRCRYGEAVLSPPGGKAEKTKGVAEPIFKMVGPGIYRWNQPPRGGGGVEAGFPVCFSLEERGKMTPVRIRKMAGGERQVAFDAGLLRFPLSVRSLRAGDRVRPFGLAADKKIKEILIDRKVPREERWGRPVVCDAGGRIVWIPGVLRSADAAVTPSTRRTIVLRADIGGEPPS
jgi:tRNA(Ile)-lysidine synthase